MPLRSGLATGNDLETSKALENACKNPGNPRKSKRKEREIRQLHKDEKLACVTWKSYLRAQDERRETMSEPSPRTTHGASEAVSNLDTNFSSLSKGLLQKGCR
jgi:hypothetical protein